jgi:DTW domain-containing protein YfiP
VAASAGAETRTTTRPRAQCAACLLRGDCLCDDVPRIENRTEIVILRHYSEEGRVSNSGRLVAQALARCRIHGYGRLGQPLPDDALAGDGCALLFPEPVVPDAPRPTRLIVLDASWSQARKMRQRIAGLRGMPIFALPGAAGDGPARPVRTLRTPPFPGQLPTILAIAEALAVLEGDAVAAPLRALWDRTVRRMTQDQRHPARWLDG